MPRSPEPQASACATLQRRNSHLLRAAGFNPRNAESLDGRNDCVWLRGTTRQVSSLNIRSACPSGNGQAGRGGSRADRDAHARSPLAQPSYCPHFRSQGKGSRPTEEKNGFIAVNLGIQTLATRFIALKQASPTLARRASRACVRCRVCQRGRRPLRHLSPLP